MPCVGRTTSTKRVATTAVRRHDSETGLGGRRLFALLSGQGTCVFASAKKEKGGEKTTSTKGQSVQPRLGCTLIANVSPRNQRARVTCANIMCSPLLAGLLQVAKQVTLKKTTTEKSRNSEF